MRWSTCTTIVFLFLGIATLPLSSAFADDAANDFMKETWRRYKTAPALISIVSERSFDAQGAVKGMQRFIAFCSERGELRVSSPTNTWVFRAGQVYGDSKYFPGSYINQVVGANSGAALAVMDSMWPLTRLPLDVRLRMASSWEEAFGAFIEHVGPDGSIAIEKGAWPGDDAPATLIRFTAADGAARATIWVDRNTKLVRGTLLESALGHVSSVSEPELHARLGQEIRFATSGRTKYEDFEGLSTSFNTRFSMPVPGEAPAEGE